MKVSIIAVALLLSGLGSAAQADSFKIDPNHTTVVFKINHLGFSSVFGSFSGVDGKFTIDDAKPEKSSLELSIKTDTVSTFVTKRDDHLKSPDFFNVKQFPTMSFHSKSVKKTGANQYEIKGDLTLHGVSKPITIAFSRFNTGKDPWGNIRTGGEAHFKIKRSEFDMTFMNKPGEVGDEVELMVGVEGTKS